MQLKDYLHHRIGKSVFLQNFLSIASANLISQALLFAATPVLTRLFLPEDFGVAALFLSALQILASFCTWRFDRTIPNAGSEQAAGILTGFATVAVILVALTTWLVVYVNPMGVMQLGSMDKLGTLAYWLPAAVLATGFVQIGSARLARSTELKVVSRSVVVYSIIYLILGLIGGAMGTGATGLTLSAIVALWCQVLTLILYTKRNPVRRVSYKRLHGIFRRNIRVASTASVVTLVNTISFAAPVFLLSLVYPMAQVGLYVLMVRLIATPLGVVTKSLALSFWSRSAELVRAKDYNGTWRLYLKVTFTLSILAAGVALACLLINRYLAFFLGSEWIDAGPVLVASIPYLIGVAMVSPTNHLWVLERQGRQLFADGLRLLLISLSVTAAYQLKLEFTVTVLLISCSSLAGHAALFYMHAMIYRYLRQQTVQHD